MKEVLEIIQNVITTKEVYGTFLIVIACYVVYSLIAHVVDKMFNQGAKQLEIKKRNTILQILKKTLRYIITTFGIVALLGLYGVNVKAMLAGLGIAGTVIGLALQDTFKDIISGINIINENFFIVGDIVKFNDFTGEVVEFGLRSTKIRNVSGETLVVANRNINQISNLSQSSQKVTININVAYEVKVETVEKVIKNKILPTINKIDNVKEDSAQYLGVNDLADSCVKYLVMFRCNRETQWQAKRDALRHIKLILDAEKIKIPYPQLEVHNEK